MIKNSIFDNSTISILPVNLPPPPATVERCDGETALDDVGRPEEEKRESVTPSRRCGKLQVALLVRDEEGEGPEEELRRAAHDVMPVKLLSIPFPVGQHPRRRKYQR